MGQISISGGETKQQIKKIEFVSRYSGQPVYGQFTIDCTKYSKLSFTLSFTNCNIRDSSYYVRLYNSQGSVVRSFTSTGNISITLDSSWGQNSFLTVFLYATADYANAAFSNIKFE